MLSKQNKGSSREENNTTLVSKRLLATFRGGEAGRKYTWGQDDKFLKTSQLLLNQVTVITLHHGMNSKIKYITSYRHQRKNYSKF